MTSNDPIIAFLAAHGATVEHVTHGGPVRDTLWVRSEVTWAGYSGVYAVTDAIPATMADARTLLGY